jgi:hypothetical protein
MFDFIGEEDAAAQYSSSTSPQHSFSSGSYEFDGSCTTAKLFAGCAREVGVAALRTGPWLRVAKGATKKGSHEREVDVVLSRHERAGTRVVGASRQCYGEFSNCRSR